MKISVVIATRNEEKNIEACARSILAQSFPREQIEIIVVDNGSTDKTIELAKKNADAVYDLSKETDLSNVKNFRGAQLNFGVSKAKGEIIFFPDADMTFDKDLILEAVGKLRDADALYVPEIVCGRGFFGKIRNFERSFYNGTCIDGVRFVKKDMFLNMGGFDVQNIVFGPDDWDFTKILKKNGIKIGTTSKNLFHHEEWLTLGVYLAKKKKYVDTFAGYIAKWGEKDEDIKKQFGVQYRYFGVFTEHGKWKKLVAHPILTLGMFFLKGLVGVVYIMNRK